MTALDALSSVIEVGNCVAYAQGCGNGSATQTIGIVTKIHQKDPKMSPIVTIKPIERWSYKGKLVGRANPVDPGRLIVIPWENVPDSMRMILETVELERGE